MEASSPQLLGTRSARGCARAREQPPRERPLGPSLTPPPFGRSAAGGGAARHARCAVRGRVGGVRRWGGRGAWGGVDEDLCCSSVKVRQCPRTKAEPGLGYSGPGARRLGSTGTQAGPTSTLSGRTAMHSRVSFQNAKGTRKAKPFAL